MYGIRATLENPAIAAAMGDAVKAEVAALASKYLAWLEEHPHGKLSLEELKIKMRELESAYNPIITKVYASLPHESVPTGEHQGQEDHQHPAHDTPH